MTSYSVLNSIGKTVQSYFDGMHFGDTSRLRRAIHPDAFLFGYYHGEFSRMSFEDSMSEVEGMDKPSEAGEVFDMVIDSTDVTGLTAQLRVTELYAGVRYTAYSRLRVRF